MICGINNKLFSGYSYKNEQKFVDIVNDVSSVDCYGFFGEPSLKDQVKNRIE